MFAESPTESEIRTAWNTGLVLHSEGGLQFQVQTSPEQPHKAHCSQACAPLRDKMEASQRTSCKRCQNELARRLLATTRRNWDSEPKKKQIPTKELHRKLGIVPIAMELRIRREGWAKRMTEQIQKHAISHSNWWRQFLDKRAWTDTPAWRAMTPWEKQFRDDINSLKEFDESDDFVRELNGDLKKVFHLYAEDFCALDSNVIRARYWSTKGPEEREEALGKETLNTCQCRSCHVVRVSNHVQNRQSR